MLTRKHFLQCLAASPAFLAIAARAAETSGGSPFPPMLDARVPFAPTAFPSVGGAYVVYELYLTNFSASPITVRHMEVHNAEEAASQPLAAFEDANLGEIIQPIGSSPPKEMPGQIAAGATSIAYLWLPFENMRSVPSRLRHKVMTADNVVDGVVITTRGTDLLVLAPPVRGAGWRAYDGPSNRRDNHHRRGIFAVDGRMVISRRFATDWFLNKNGVSRSGDVHNLRSYYAYGEPVFAVADATVLLARDGAPDNVPGPAESFRPLVPNTMSTIGGNQIMLDLGNGRYAWYFHFQPGSLLVKAGDRVRRNQPLARIGCSGDSNLPHLHFEVTTSPKVMAGEGVPYLIDQYRVWTADNVWQTRNRELPLDRMLIDFGS